MPFNTANLTPMTPLPQRIRTHLCKIAPNAAPITYQALAIAMTLSPPNTIRQITTALETLMDADAAASHPLIASLVISKSGSGLPAAGFFEHAKGLGRFSGDPTGPEAQMFHQTEFNVAISFWATHHGA